MKQDTYKCPCCKNKSEGEGWLGDICEVCTWEIGVDGPDYRIPLSKARMNFKKYGHCYQNCHRCNAKGGIWSLDCKCVYPGTIEDDLDYWQVDSEEELNSMIAELEEENERLLRKAEAKRRKRRRK